MNLPTLIAGPLLRRVEPTAVTVWVAFSKKQKVQLVIWDDNEVEASGDEAIDQAGHLTRTDPVDTIEFAGQLHIAVVTLDTSQQKLKEDRAYCYNVYFGDAAPLNNDLNTEKLLEERTNFDGVLIEVVPLGYNPGRLPTLIIPNSDLKKLHIAHGSCRKIHGIGDEAFRHLDEYLKKKLANPEERPQQLFLTGDQIYADEIPRIVLPSINELGNELFNGKTETLLFKKEENSTQTFPADLQHFPPNSRQKVMNESAKFTGNGISSHLLSFPEYCGTYLHYWSVEGWSPELRKMLVQYKLSDYGEETGSFLYYYLVNIFKGLDLQKMQDLLFSFGPKKKEEEKSDEEKKEEEEKKKSLQDLLTDLNGNVPTGISQEKAERINLLEQTFISRFGPSFPGFNDIVKVMKIVEAMDEEDEAAKKKKDALSGRLSKGGTLEESRATVDFLEVLPLARRVLANIPSLMIFDDHEVTDDWNFSHFWVNRSRTSTLGVQVMRSALMAYTLFQDWGNVPAEYPQKLLNMPDSPDEELKELRENYVKTTGRNKGDKIILLEKIAAYGKALSAGNQPLSFEPLTESLDRLLIFGENTGDDPPPLAAPVRWHHDIPSGSAHTFFLDTRTRREYDQFTGFPGLIPKEALDEQLPERIALENYPVVFVVSPVPALGPPVVEEFAQPIVGMFEGGFKSEGIGGAPEGAISSALKRDMEAWAFSERHLEQLLERLAQFRKVVILSGDIHYGYSAYADYWKERKEEHHARIIQLVSSSFKQGWSLDFILLKSGFAQRLLAGFDFEFEKHGWKKNIVKAKGDMAPRHRIRLRRDPVVLPRQGWHPGTTTDPEEPEWVWRLRMAVDKTKFENLEKISDLDLDRFAPNDLLKFSSLNLEIDEDLPEEPEEEEEVTIDREAIKETYLQMAARHNALFKLGRSRRFLWQPHFGHVFFTELTDPEEGRQRIVLNHEYHYSLRADGLINDDEAPDPERAGIVSGPFTTHSIDLDASDSDKSPPVTLNKTGLPVEA